MNSLFQDKHLTLFQNKPAKYNLSTYFIYPILDIHSYYSNNIYDTYLFNSQKDFKEEVLFIVYKFLEVDVVDGLVNNFNYESLKKYLLDNKNYFTDYRIKDFNKEETENIKDEYVCFVFKIPSDYRQDYYNFLNGEYSKMSMKMKEKITDNGHKDWNDIKDILLKSSKRRAWLEDMLNVEIPKQAELCGKYSKELETFSYKDLL